MRRYFSLHCMLTERYLHVSMYVCMGAFVSGRASGAAAPGGSVQGAANLRKKQLLNQTKENSRNVII
jgi:hypothetical protein